VIGQGLPLDWVIHVELLVVLQIELGDQGMNHAQDRQKEKEVKESEEEASEVRCGQVKDDEAEESKSDVLKPDLKTVLHGQIIHN